MEETRCALGVLLAGGKSSRMGVDKATLELEGQSLLHTQISLLEQAAKQVLVSRNEPEFIQDVFENSGPLAGLHACLKHAHEQGVLGEDTDVVLVPVDMPLLNTKLLWELIQAGRSSGATVFYEDQPLPIYFPNAAAALAELEVMLSDNQRIVKTFLERMNAESVACSSSSLLANANTPMQWTLIKRKR